MLLNHNIPWRYVYRKVRYELLFVIAYSLLVAIVQETFNLHHISIPMSVPMMLGTIISLLLAFRSNQAYDRWWEARIIWGAIVNDSRSLTRQLLTYTGYQLSEVDAENEYFIRRFVRRQIAWCYCLGQSLRKLECKGDCERLMTNRDMQRISNMTNQPNAILAIHGMDIRSAHERRMINDFQQVSLDQTISRLCDSMGKCERIKSTIFPSTYSLYIHFTIILFIILLPFSLVEYFGLVEVPLVTAIAAVFLLIEKMAIHLQDPFENKPTDTPMTTIARNIERDLMQMLEEEKAPKVAVANVLKDKVQTTFYQM